MTEAEELELLRLRKAKALAQAKSAPAEDIQPAPVEEPGLLSRAASAVAKGAGDVADMYSRTYAEDIPAVVGGRGDPAGKGPGGARLLKRAAALAAGVGDMGTFGHGDEVAAAMETAKQRLGAPAVSWQDALRDKAPKPGLTERYYANRDKSEALTKAMGEQEPGAYLGGQIAALAPGLTANLGKAAATRGARLVRALKLAVPQGAAYGAGASEAKPISGKDGEIGKYLGDAAVGGALAAGTAGVLQGGSELAPPAARALRDFSIDQGRRFLLSGADQLSKRAPVPAAAVEEALASGAIRPFGQVEGARERLSVLVAEQDALRRSIIDELAARGVRGPKASAVADDLIARAKALRPNTMDPALPRELETQAAELMTKVGNSPRRTLALPQAEQLKSSLQDKAKYGAVEETTLNEIRRDVASVLRQANEDAIDAAVARAPAGSDTARFGAQFVPVKQREGRLIEALKAAERGTARASQRQSGGAMQDAIGGAEAVAAAVDKAQSGPPGWLGYLKKLAGGGRAKSAEARAAYALANALESRSPDFLARYAPALARVEVGGVVGEDDPEALRRQAIIDSLRRQ